MKKAILVGILVLLIVMPVTAWANSQGSVQLKNIQIVYRAAMVELEGEVKYVKNLETPHYELNGVVLQADFDLKGLVGYYVKVKGYMLEGPSIYMKQRMLVKEFDILNQG